MIWLLVLASIPLAGMAVALGYCLAADKLAGRGMNRDLDAVQNGPNRWLLAEEHRLELDRDDHA